MCTVVVIDDHPPIRMALKSYLEREGGCRVVGEGNGTDALACVRTHNPDLVILDLALSFSDGLGLIRQICALEPKVKVLVLSAREERIFITRAAEQGASGYVSKSSSMEEILSAVQLVRSGYRCFPGGGHAGGRNVPVLSRRELAVLRFIAQGGRNKDIAQSLFISPKTVSTYKIRLLNKLNLKTTLDLVEYARMNGLA
jgi:two-component system response regulator FimZ (fimbrial Z protein)/two-component system response regulator EvgA